MALIDKASLLMVPSTYEAGKLYNVLPSGNRAPDNKGGAGYDQTRADFDFDRGSNAAATRIGSDGLLKKYRENLLTFSNDFGTTWINYQSAETGGQPDKDGGSTAWKLTRTTTGSSVLYKSGLSFSLATLSLYAKASEDNWILIEGVSSGGIPIQYFDLQNGVKGTSGGVGFVDSSITSVGGGWYRISITMSVSGGNRISILNASADNTASGSIGDGVYIMNAQLETGLCSTEYLNSTSVTAKAGVLIDLPRINYDANGENGALLLEPSRQQLIQFSEYIGASYWTKTNATITDNATTSPEGVVNASALTENTSTSTHFMISQLVPASASTYYSASYFVKYNGRHFQILGSTGSEGGGYVNFDLINGEVGNSDQLTGSIESLGNGWYRCTGTNISTSSATEIRLLPYLCTNPTSSRAESYLGDGTSGVYIWGAQIEPNASYATSYIPNHSGTGGVTRAADSCLGAGDVDSINSVEGVLYWEGSFDSTSTTAGAIALIGANQNRVQFYNSGSNVVALITPNGSTSFTATTSGSVDITSNHKYAVKWSLNDFALWVDGVKIATDTSGATFNNDALTELRFSDFGSNYLYANVKQLAVFNEALSDSELATLTTL